MAGERLRREGMKVLKTESIVRTGGK